jgi:hypothetical protein
MANSFVTQTTTQIEHTILDDGTTKHRLLKAWTQIIGEPRAKKPKKKVMDVSVKEVAEEYFT